MTLKTHIALTALAATLGLPAMADPLVVRMNADIRGTDGFNRDANTDTVLHHVFETLVAFRDDLTVGPLLATDWTLSEDATTYSFALRDGVSFHDGSAFTSADVKRNWDWRMDAANDWRCRSAFDGSQGLEVTAVDTPDDDTVVFTLARPNALFLMQLANVQCNFWMAGAANFAADGTWIDGSAIGTGPFTLTDWAKGQSISLGAFDGYVATQAETTGYSGDRTPRVDAVQFLIVPDQSTAETAFYAGQIDVLPGLAPDRVAQAEGRGMKVSSTPGLSYTPMLVQTRDPLLGDIRMRQAIAHAIDFAALAEARNFGTAGFNPSAVAQASAYFDEDFLEWPEYDVAKAQALLKEAGYDGQPIRIQTNNRYAGMYENSVLIQAMLQAAGINAELETLEWATQLDHYLAGSFQMQSFGYSARLDPALMYGTFIGNKDEKGSKQWENAEAEALYIQATETSDFAARKALFKQLHKLMVADLPIFGLYYDAVIDAVQPGVEGYAVWAGDKTRLWGVSKVE